MSESRGPENNHVQMGKLRLERGGGCPRPPASAVGVGSQLCLPSAPETERLSVGMWAGEAVWVPIRDKRLGCGRLPAALTLLVSQLHRACGQGWL